MVPRNLIGRPRYAIFAALIAMFAALLTPSVAATTCVAPNHDKTTQSLLPVGEPDQEVFNVAVLGHVNFRRCLEGLHPVESHSGLTGAAVNHARWMADESLLSHQSTIPGQSTIEARVKSAVTDSKTGSENIGYVHRYRVDEESVFFSGPRNCDFRSINGRNIPAHTYSSLAERIVTLWMNSPSHRVNVLDRNAALSATGIAYDAKAQHCGVYYMAQEFAG